MHDLNYSGFLGIIQALRFMEEETVAIIGPQSSVIAHAVLHIANELQVPFLSFVATDPTLSSLQYPYFVMTSQNDHFQMAAIAEIIVYYGWTNTIAIYIDDDYGRNGIDALGDSLANKRCKISDKAALSFGANHDEITNVLVKVALSESRIIVLHTYVDTGLQVLDIAQKLGMMGSGYAWIATNWLSTLIDIDSPLTAETLNNMQGLLTLCMYTQDSKLKRNFTGKWKRITGRYASRIHLGLNSYALYAYDTVWILAHAIDAFLKNGGNISFSRDPRLLKGSLNLDSLSIFNGGKILLENILQVNLTGITGPIQFNKDRCLINPAYEVLNVIGTGYRKIGYWSNYSGLSVVPPETLYTKPKNKSRSSQKLYDMIWPGQSSVKPRGWVFPNRGRQLIIGVPNRVSYRDFISKVDGTDMFKGYCFDVFTAAVNLLSYAVPYKLVAFGDGIHNPSCTELVRLITTGVYDAAIGDIAIITSRTKIVDFTQPYIESGLVVVAPVRKVRSNALAFLRPFTAPMWGVIALSFLVVGAVVWILEHRFNDQFRGPPKRQLVTVLWFSFSTMFFAHRENVVSTLGRIVLLIWLFVILIITSSYTASLTSMLTVQQLSSPIDGIESLMASNDPIGYQEGSYARNYLIEELGISASRLVPLDSPEDSAKALKDGPGKGGVAAIIDERAYLELFLSTRCEFTIVGKEFTKSGWGFAFPRDSPLAIDMSTAILKLSENGELQRIHDKWLMKSACSSQDKKLAVDRLELKSFWGLYMICGAACGLALLVFFMRMIRQFCRHCPEPEDPDPSVGQSSRSSRLQTFLSFADEKEEEVNRWSKRRQMERGSGSNRSNQNDESINGSSSIRRDIEVCSNKSVNNSCEP